MTMRVIVCSYPRVYVHVYQVFRCRLLPHGVAALSTPMQCSMHAIMSSNLLKTRAVTHGYHSSLLSSPHSLPHSTNPATTQNPQFHPATLSRSSTFNIPTPNSINFAHTFALSPTGQAGVSQYLLFKPFASAAAICCLIVSSWLELILANHSFPTAAPKFVEA